MIGSSNQAGSPANVSAAQVDRQAPMISWPSPPTLIRPTRDGIATASAVSSSGIIVTITSDSPYVLPSVEARMSRYEAIGSLPEIARISPNRANATRAVAP